MSKLDELINKLCPNGVGYFTLGELEDSGKIKLGRGNIISKQEMNTNPGDYPVFSSSSTNDGMIGTYGKYMFDDERITWSIDGGGKFFYRNKIKYSVTNVGGWLKVLTPSINARYLFHLLSNEWGKKKFDYIHKAHPSVIRDEYLLAIPPLEVQCEIVRILDNFAELTAELTAELSLRKSQYKFYLNSLFSSNNYETIELVKNNKILRGKRLTTRDLITSGKYPVYHGGIEPLGYYNDFNRQPDTVMIINVGASAGSIAYSKDKFWSSDGCYCLDHSDKFLNKYLYYFLLTKEDYLKSKVRKAGIPTLDKPIVEKINVPAISIDEQRNIVDILDKFNSITSDIQIGLPAEIEGRKKQYEYYRDKFLTFKRLED